MPPTDTAEPTPTTDAATRERRRAEAVRHIIPHFANNAALREHPRVFVRGKGCELTDDEGNTYLDTFASLLTTITGHCCEPIAEAIRRQLDELEFFPNYEDAFTPPLIDLAVLLDRILPGDLSVSFYVNSGSEANETALKMARQYHVQRGERQRYKILARRGSYHGTTLGTTAVTGMKFFTEHFEPLLPGVVFTPAVRENDGPDALRRVEQIIHEEGPETISAFIMDPIPGSNSGYPTPPDGYLQGVRELCDQHGIVLIFDEVQTGFGKTGKWFACEHFGVTPDIMSLGKGFSGGYVPLGATVTTPKIADVFREPGFELRSGSTYGGHTLACAATVANIQYIESEGLVERAATMGKALRERLETLRQYDLVHDISGLGLLQAVKLTPDDRGKQAGGWIRKWCYEQKMILRNNGPILVLAPALTIEQHHMDRMCELIETGIVKAMEHFGGA